MAGRSYDIGNLRRMSLTRSGRTVVSPTGLMMLDPRKVLTDVAYIGVARFEHLWSINHPLGVFNSGTDLPTVV